MLCMDKAQMTDAEKAYAKAIGEALKARKEKIGLTFDDLAEMSGVSRANVSRIVYGTVDARMADLRRLAEALDISVDKILDAADAATVKK